LTNGKGCITIPLNAIEEEEEEELEEEFEEEEFGTERGDEAGQGGRNRRV
jgi:hypothetical protein